MDTFTVAHCWRGLGKHPVIPGGGFRRRNEDKYSPIRHDSYEAGWKGKLWETWEQKALLITESDWSLSARMQESRAITGIAVNAANTVLIIAYIDLKQQWARLKVWVCMMLGRPSIFSPVFTHGHITSCFYVPIFLVGFILKLILKSSIKSLIPSTLTLKVV